MIWLTSLGLIFILSFGYVLLYGAPYLPTLKPQIDTGLKLAGLKPGDHLLELGCGDGKVLLAAASLGLKVTGYELNPFLALLAWFRTRAYRSQVTVIWGNFWTKPWPPADAIYVFLLQKYMSKLDTAINHYQHKPIKLISVAFTVPDKSFDKQTNGVSVYTYR